MKSFIFSVVAALVFTSLPSGAAVPVPIKDIYAVTGGGSVNLGVEMGGYFYYGACKDEPIYGCELYRTPIAGAGAELVKDIAPGSDSSGPRYFVNANGTLFFVANNTELWMSDGSEAGTTRVRSFSDIYVIDETRPVALGGEVIFSAEDWSGTGRELWVSDGTTTTKYDICPGSCSSTPFYITVAGGRVFFRADNGTELELWKYEPGSPGTVSQVGDIATGPTGSFPRDFAALGANLIFQATGDVDPGVAGSVEQGLWTSDGTSNTKVAGGTELFGGYDEIVVAGSRAFFDNGGSEGQEIWSSDGTTPNTILLRDINIGPSGSDPQHLTAVGQGIFFSAFDGIDRELWHAPAAGGAIPLDIVPGVGAPSDLRGLTDLNGSQLFFIADDGSGIGTEPWVSNGTPAGTTLVSDTDPGPNSGGSPEIVAFQNYAFFISGALADGENLWRSDGTAVGTNKLTQLSRETGSSSISSITVFGGYGYFCANDGTTGSELWRTDGTEAGTIRLEDINSGSGNGCNKDYGIVVVGSELFFSGHNGTTPGLWKSNGAPAGAVAVEHFISAPRQLTEHGGLLFFEADDGRVPATGLELWTSNGSTGAGTALVKDLYPGPTSAGINDLTSVGGFLYFGARWNGNSQPNEFELWQSNGTPGGTSVLKDLDNGTYSSGPGDFGSVDGTVLFTAYNGVNGGNGRELWTTDGTPAGTQVLKDINSSGSGAGDVIGFFELGSFAYFVGNDGTSGAELWRTDGTAPNTQRFGDIRSGSSGSYPQDFAIAGTNLLFTARDGITDRELWKTDGSTVSQVKDINPSGASSPRDIFATGVGNEAYLNATADYSVGTGLWKTDGTSGGTVVLATNLSGDGGTPKNFANLGTTIVFTADVGISGQELWTFADADCGDAPDPAVATAGEYPTLLVNGGACHRIDSGGLFLGTSRDADDDGQPAANADGDDTDGSDDDDGVTFSTEFNLGHTASLIVNASGSGFLNVWIDWSGDGDWDSVPDFIDGCCTWVDVTDHTVYNRELVAGPNIVSIEVPGDATVGTTYARFRFESKGSHFVRGVSFDGEVEDYAITIGELLDFGDAPDPFDGTDGEYPTRLAYDGARHRVVPGIYLGSGVDEDGDGQPTASADGDDLDGNDDDDGVTFTSALAQGTTASVDVVASTSDGYLSAWIDFNGNGDWGDAGEKIVDDQSLSSGTNNLNFNVPAEALGGTTFARFRFDTGSDGDQPTGAAEDGEVEDYQVFIGASTPPTADAGLDRTIAPRNQSIALGGMPSATDGTPPYSYSWAVTPGTAGADYTLSSTTDDDPVFTGITEQTYTATLTVTDSTPLQGMDSATITVEVPDDRDLYNEDLTGTKTYEGCATITAELVVIKDGADITFIAPVVELWNGFTVELGALFTAVNGTPASCSAPM